MILLENELLWPLSFGQVSFKSHLLSKKTWSTKTTRSGLQTGAFLKPCLIGTLKTKFKCKGILFPLSFCKLKRLLELKEMDLLAKYRFFFTAFKQRMAIFVNQRTSWKSEKFTRLCEVRCEFSFLSCPQKEDRSCFVHIQLMKIYIRKRCYVR